MSQRDDLQLCGHEPERMVGNLRCHLSRMSLSFVTYIRPEGERGEDIIAAEEG